MVGAANEFHMRHKRRALRKFYNFLDHNASYLAEQLDDDDDDDYNHGQDDTSDAFDSNKS